MQECYLRSQWQLHQEELPVCFLTMCPAQAVLCCDSDGGFTHMPRMQELWGDGNYAKPK